MVCSKLGYLFFRFTRNFSENWYGNREGRNLDEIKKINIKEWDDNLIRSKERKGNEEGKV